MLKVKYLSAFKGIRRFNVSFENIMKQLTNSQRRQFFSAWTPQQVHESHRYFTYRRGGKGLTNSSTIKKSGHQSLFTGADRCTVIASGLLNITKPCPQD